MNNDKPDYVEEPEKSGSGILDQTWGMLKKTKDDAVSFLGNARETFDAKKQEIKDKVSEKTKDIPDQQPESIDSMVVALNSKDGWVENVMTSMRQPTYHIRFFMTEDTPISMSDYQNYEDYQKEILNRRATTICESGVTGLSIIDLNLTTIVSHTPSSRSLAPTTMTMSIKEPMGVQLMDYMVRTANELKVKNYSKVFYYLEIYFQGYNEDGTFQTNPCSSFKNNGHWIYSLVINNIDTTLTEDGAVYNISMLCADEAQIKGDDYTLPFTIMPSGGTVGEMLNGLAENLNKAYTEMYQTDQYRQYEFKLQTFEYENQTFDPATFMIVSETEEDINYIRHLTMDGTGAAKGTFGRGIKIHDIIEMLLANSEASQKLGKAVMTQSNLDDGKVEVKDAVIFRVVPSVEYGEYNFVMNNYNLKYIFTVVPYLTQEPIVSQDQIKVSKDPQAQAANILRLRKNGYLSKRYDYLYTGENTEILNLDLKFSAPWSVMLPRIAGFGNSIESTSTGAMYRSKESITSDRNEYSDAYRELQEMQALNTQIDDIRDRISLETVEDKKRELEARLAKMSDVYDKYKEREADLRETIGRLGDDLKQDIFEYNKRESDRIGQLSSDRVKIRYSEDLTSEDRILDVPSPMPVTIRQSNSDTRFTQAGVLPDKYHRDRSIYGAIMDQMYQTQGGAMQTITMDIIGDPYWLGVSNLERTFETRKAVNSGQPKQRSLSSTDPTRMYVDDGDALMFITFNYPQGFGDETGNVVLSKTDTFTGIYKVKSVEHNFSGGIFKQTITANRLPLIQVLEAMGSMGTMEVKK